MALNEKESWKSGWKGKVEMTINILKKWDALVEKWPGRLRGQRARLQDPLRQRGLVLSTQVQPREGDHGTRDRWRPRVQLGAQAGRHVFLLAAQGSGR